MRLLQKLSEFFFSCSEVIERDKIDIYGAGDSFEADLIEAEIVLRTICRQGIDLSAIIRVGRIFCAGQYFTKVECAESFTFENKSCSASVVCA